MEAKSYGGRQSAFPIERFGEHAVHVAAWFDKRDSSYSRQFVAKLSVRVESDKLVKILIKHPPVMYCITQSGTPVKILVKHSSVILHYTVRGFPVRLHYTRGFTLGECASMQKTALVPHKRQKGKRRGKKDKYFG